MPKYSIERKESVLLKLLNPRGFSIAQIAQDEGISNQTLYAWRNKARESGVFMPNKDTPESWDKHTKFTVLVETESMNVDSCLGIVGKKDYTQSKSINGERPVLMKLIPLQ